MVCALQSLLPMGFNQRPPAFRLACLSRIEPHCGRRTEACRHLLLRLAIACTLIAIAASTSGCSHTESPVAPAPVPATPAVPPPAAPTPPIAVTVTGRITEAPPTSTTGVWDATLTLDDGVNSWHSAATIGGVGRGEYTLPGLHAGRFRASVAADGFVAVTRNVIVNADSTVDFQLLPVATTKSVTVHDDLGESDGTCSDGTQTRPCHIVALPVHNRGMIDATLTWPAGGPALALSLYAGGSPLATVPATNTGNGHLVTNVEGGAVYTVRVTYASGKGPASYSLKIAYPN